MPDEILSGGGDVAFCDHNNTIAMRITARKFHSAIEYIEALEPCEVPFYFNARAMMIALRVNNTRDLLMTMFASRGFTRKSMHLGLITAVQEGSLNFVRYLCWRLRSTVILMKKE